VLLEHIRSKSNFRVDESRIRSVQSYFDPGAVPRQLGLQMVVQPHAAGPFTFGTSARVGGRASGAPGAFSLTSVYTRSEADVKRVQTYSREIAAPLPHLKGFMGWARCHRRRSHDDDHRLGDTDDPRQLITERRHAETMRAFFGSDLTAGGWTSVWVPQRLHARWRRVPSAATGDRACSKHPASAPGRNRNCYARRVRICRAFAFCKIDRCLP